ncbi:MAG TPA: hypothetical protein DCK79_05175 [Candidatus Atribacteria bacterium]|nr:hypothetical protein [Candidatus Atribacteria bacterium]
MVKCLDRLLKDLEKLNDVHLEQGEAIGKAFGGAVYAFDLLSFAVLNRSMSLTSGFITLMRKDNFVAAIPLIRTQLDNFLRYAAGWLVSDPHEFAAKILSGKHIRNIKTKEGKRMTDRFLVDEFSKKYKWIKSVYENTSGYIHLSDKHMLINITELDSKQRTTTFKISDKDDHIPEKFKVEAVMAFTKITELILHRIYSWRYTKDNPQALRKQKRGSSQVHKI